MTKPPSSFRYSTSLSPFLIVFSGLVSVQFLVYCTFGVTISLLFIEVAYNQLPGFWSHKPLSSLLGEPGRFPAVRSAVENDRSLKKPDRGTVASLPLAPLSLTMSPLPVVDIYQAFWVLCQTFNVFISFLS